mgnify:FL=1
MQEIGCEDIHQRRNVEAGGCSVLATYMKLIAEAVSRAIDVFSSRVTITSTPALWKRAPVP